MATSLTDAERRSLIERASTLDERASGAFARGSSNPASPASPEASQRIDRWRSLASPGDPDGFERLLAWKGLDTAGAHRLLARPGWSGLEEEPDWIAILDRVLSCNAHPSDGNPFYVRFLSVGRALLDHRIQISAQQVDARVLAILEYGLVRWLTVTCGATIGTAHCGDFAIGETFKRFLLDRPVLARHASTTVGRWVDVAGEFFARLQHDWNDIWTRFFSARTPVPVVAVEPGLSDPHDGGRSVARVTFADGSQLIYKPRPVSLDLAYVGLIAWMRVNGAPVSLRAPVYLAQDDYAWVEHVDHVFCRDWDDLRAFCRSAGALMCVAHLLDATDLHDGNVIACGRDAVAVDLETLLAPHLRPQDEVDTRSARWRAERDLLDSVVRTAMLPMWRFRSGEAPADVGTLGALCGASSTISYERSPESTPIHDAGQIDAWYTTLYPQQATRGDGARALAHEVLDGFCSTYRFVLDHRERLLADDGPLPAFARQPVRVLFRDTSIYAELMRHACTSSVMDDGASWSLEFAWLERIAARHRTRPWYLPLIDAERRALVQLDVPRFSAMSDATDMILPTGEHVPGFTNEPGFTTVRRRLAQASEKTLAHQAALASACFAARLASRPHEDVTVPSFADATRASSAGLASDPVWLKSQALAVAEILEGRVIRGDDGGATWVAPEPVDDSACYRLSPAGGDLQTGTLGAALFLSALDRATGEPRFKTLALAALHHACRDIDLRRPSPDALHRLAVMLANGSEAPGAFFFGLMRTATLLDDSDVAASATRLAQLIDVQRLWNCPADGVRTGLAGTLLGLLAVARHDATGIALDRAVEGGRVLLARAPRDADGRRGWFDPRGGRPVTFGDGAAGIAFTLLKLFDASGDGDFRDAAVEAMRCVDAHVGPDRGPSTFSSSRSAGTFPNQGWCGGAAGMILACMSWQTSSVAAALDVGAALDAMLASTLAAPSGGLDTVCCGTFGRVECLLEAGRRLDRPDLMNAARHSAERAVDLADGTGGFHLIPHARGTLPSPGFYHGLAGIGYGLLRLADPGTLPSVLCWD